MGVAVNGDLMPLACGKGHGVPTLVGGSVNAVAQHKEGGCVAVSAQLVDDLLGPDVVGAVVKGDGHPLLVGIKRWLFFVGREGRCRPAFGFVCLGFVFLASRQQGGEG